MTQYPITLYCPNCEKGIPFYSMGWSIRWCPTCNFPIDKDQWLKQPKEKSND